MSDAASFDPSSDCHGSSRPSDNSLQIAFDTFNGNNADSYIYKCYSSGSPYKGGATIPKCYEAVTFCIGAHSQQHACSVEDECYHVDWTGPHAPTCSDNLIQYVSIQAPGLNMPCCDSEFCTKADDTTTTDIKCLDRGRQLWLCVNDGGSAECVKLVDNTICSANFTSTVHTSSKSGTQTGSGYGSTSGTPKPTDSSSANSGSGLDPTTRNQVIVGSVLGGITVIVLLCIWCYRQSKREARAFSGGTDYPDSYGKQDFPLTTYDPKPAPLAAFNYSSSQTQDQLLHPRSPGYVDERNVDMGGGNLGPTANIYGGAFTSAGRDHNVNQPQGPQFIGGTHYHS